MGKGVFWGATPLVLEKMPQGLPHPHPLPSQWLPTKCVTLWWHHFCATDMQLRESIFPSSSPGLSPLTVVAMAPWRAVPELSCRCHSMTAAPCQGHTTITW